MLRNNIRITSLYWGLGHNKKNSISRHLQNQYKHQNSTPTKNLFFSILKAFSFIQRPHLLRKSLNSFSKRFKRNNLKSDYRFGSNIILFVYASQQLLSFCDVIFRYEYWGNNNQDQGILFSVIKIISILTTSFHIVWNARLIWKL